MNSENEKRLFNFLLVTIHMLAFAYVFRIEFYTAKVILDYKLKICHHSCLQVKTCYVLC